MPWIPKPVLAGVDPQLFDEMLARAAQGDAGAHERLKRTLLRADLCVPSSAPSSIRNGPELGIWTLDAKSGQFVMDRQIDASERRYWADVERIALHSSAETRVVLVGESVARGFFLDPSVTPAHVLQAQLSRQAPDTTFEVVDLARTCLTNVTDLVYRSFALSPDVVVIFAGNNLLPDQLLQLHDQNLAGARLRQQQVESIRRSSGVAFGHWLGVAASAAVYEPMLDALRMMAEESRVPMLIIVPESNRHDWMDSLQKTGHVFTEGARPGEHRAHVAAGPPIPGRTEEFAAAVGRTAERSNLIRMVDVADLIHSEGKADRRFFYDYCHLTPEGIDIVMNAAAAAVLDFIGDGYSYESLPLCRTIVAPRVAATACFLAGVHNAHWGQSADIVHHWLSEALRADAQSKDLFRLYLEHAGRSVPGWMDPAMRGLFDPVTQAGRLLYNSKSPFNEVPLIEALASHLDGSCDAAVSMARARAANSLKRGQSLVDLMEVSNYARFSRTTNVTSVYSPMAVIPFIPQSDLDHCLELVVRLGDTRPPDATVRILLNDQEIAAIGVQVTWTQNRITLSRQALRAGCNALVIVWPCGMISRTCAEGIARAYVDGQRASLFVCYGEVHRSSSIQASGYC